MQTIYMTTVIQRLAIIRLLMHFGLPSSIIEVFDGDHTFDSFVVLSDSDITLDVKVDLEALEQCKMDCFNL